MGYYADFTFDIDIPAGKVFEAEKAVHYLYCVDCRQKETGAPSAPGYVRENPCPGIYSLQQVFSTHWEEIYVIEEKPSALVSIACGHVRGDVHIEGFTRKKWRSWESPMLDRLAPFITDGGTVRVMGEDFEAPMDWEFRGGVKETEDYTIIRQSRLKELEALEAKFGELSVPKC